MHASILQSCRSRPPGSERRELRVSWDRVWVARDISGGIDGSEASYGVMEILTQGMSDVKSDDLFCPLDASFDFSLLISFLIDGLKQ